MKTVKLHTKLKWETIINRLNKQAGYERFRYNDAYGDISEYSKDHNAWLFVYKDIFKYDFLCEYGNGWEMYKKGYTTINIT